MKATTKDVERYRIKNGPMASDASLGFNGAFRVPLNGVTLQCIASDQGGWEHVSVSLPRRCPTWDEMSHVKSLFFDDSECAMQLHPPKSEHINCHEFCLHLWAPLCEPIPRPPGWMVGV